jgi:hypothetical protein
MEQRPHTTDARFCGRWNCAWKTKSEHCRNKTACEDALLEIVQGLDFPGLSKEDRKLKFKTRE